MSTDNAPLPGDSLGDRIKKYERASRAFLAPNIPVVIRVDGKAFHTWTRHMNKPFDHGLIAAMQEATVRTAVHMQGFKLAYTQSDEATFLLTDMNRLESQPWMDYNHSKLVSISASMFTYYFNTLATERIAPSLAPAYFDSRAFSVPAEDVANVFLWRQRDWERNSLMMLARHNFSHGKLQNKKRAQIHELLHEYDVNWADLDPALKNGTWVDASGTLSHEKHGYRGIQGLIDGEAP